MSIFFNFQNCLIMTSSSSDSNYLSNQAPGGLFCYLWNLSYISHIFILHIVCTFKLSQFLPVCTYFFDAHAQQMFPKSKGYFLHFYLKSLISVQSNIPRKYSLNSYWISYKRNKKLMIIKLHLQGTSCPENQLMTAQHFC